MAIELGSRLLALLAAVAFALVFSIGHMPGIPKGRWTVAALFAIGLAMCTAAGIRDSVGAAGYPQWLTTVLAALGFSAVGVLVATMLGLSWRIGVTGLGLVITASWTLTLGYAVDAGLATAPLGLATAAIAVIASIGVIWLTNRPASASLSSAR